MYQLLECECTSCSPNPKTPILLALIALGALAIVGSFVELFS